MLYVYWFVLPVPLPLDTTQAWFSLHPLESLVCHQWAEPWCDTWEICNLPPGNKCCCCTSCEPKVWMASTRWDRYELRCSRQHRAGCLPDFLRTSRSTPETRNLVIFILTWSHYFPCPFSLPYARRIENISEFWTILDVLMSWQLFASWRVLSWHPSSVYILLSPLLAPWNTNSPCDLYPYLSVVIQHGISSHADVVIRSHHQNPTLV